MTEDEYILVTNKTAIMLANDSLREVLTGNKDWGVDRKLYETACKALSQIQDDLFKKIEYTEDEQ